MVAYSLVVALLAVITAYWVVPKIQTWAKKEVARAIKDPDTQDIFQEK